MLQVSCPTALHGNMRQHPARSRIQSHYPSTPTHSIPRCSSPCKQGHDVQVCAPFPRSRPRCLLSPFLLLISLSLPPSLPPFLPPSRSAIVAAALAAGGTYLIVRGSAKLVRLTATGVGRATNAGMLVVSATATGIENTAVVTYRVITASAAAGTRATAGGVRLICNSPSYAAGGYRAAVGGVHGGYVGVRRGCARAVGGVKAAGRGVVSVFTADYVGEVRRTRDRVVSIKVSSPRSSSNCRFLFSQIAYSRRHIHVCSSFSHDPHCDSSTSPTTLIVTFLPSFLLPRPSL
jgi:hypothetical protein